MSAVEVPEGWIATSMEEICQKIQDGTHFSPKEQSQAGDFKYVTVKNIKQWGIDLSNVTYVSENVHRVIFQRCNPGKGDVLYIKDSATTGIATINDLEEEFSLLSSVALLKPNRACIDPLYLKWYLNSPVGFKYMTDQMTGSAITRLTLVLIRNSTIPIPPLVEQKRIVAKVEMLLARANGARQRLAKVPALLKRFRQTVLAAACCGQLTEDWRQDNVDVESGAQLLHRIKIIRSERAGKDRVAARACDDVPNDVEANENTELAESWAWCRVEQIAKVCLGGTPSRKVPKYWEGEISWVSSGEVANCRISTTTERLTAEGLKNSNAKVYPPGTVLIAMIGEGKTRGQSAILDITASTNQNVAGLVFDSGCIVPEYAWLWALSLYETHRSGGRGGNYPALNGSIVRQFRFPLAPVPEQREIVRRVEALLARADRIDKRLATATRRVETLTQAILAQAFRGELVPTEAELARREGRDYEPASALLDRIRAQRQGQQEPRASRKKKTTPAK